MTAPLKLVEPIPTLPERLAAGRRAAMHALSQNPNVTITGAGPETYAGYDVLMVGQLDIGPAIDAAVMETLVQVQGGPAPLGDPVLIKQLEGLLADAKAGRVHAAAWAVVMEGEPAQVGYSWHAPGERTWFLTAAIDRMVHLWRKANYG